MTYQDIQGWFNEEAFYDFVVKDCGAAIPYDDEARRLAIQEVRDPRAAIFVEIGCWRGKSTVYLAQKIKESGKLIRLMAIDTWKGSANEPELLAEAAKCDLFAEFNDNLIKADVHSIVGAMRLDSARAAGHFKTGSVSFCFIDGDHTEPGVLRDITAWWPTIKVGGILAGHDWNTYESVRNAVKIWFCHPTITGNVWWVRKEK